MEKNEKIGFRSDGDGALIGNSFWRGRGQHSDRVALSEFR